MPSSLGHAAEDCVSWDVQQQRRQATSLRFSQKANAPEGTRARQCNLRIDGVLEQDILHILFADGPTLQQRKPTLHEKNQDGAKQHLQ